MRIDVDKYELRLRSTLRGELVAILGRIARSGDGCSPGFCFPPSSSFRLCFVWNLPPVKVTDAHVVDLDMNANRPLFSFRHFALALRATFGTWVASHKAGG
jgi:hypothetical protein